MQPSSSSRSSARARGAREARHRCHIAESAAEAHTPYTRRPFPRWPLEPRDFVQPLVAGIGGHPARVLATHAFDIVEHTGNPTPGFARSRALGTVATSIPPSRIFFIWELAESAMTPLTVKHPRISRLCLQIVHILLEHGLDERQPVAGKAPRTYWALVDKWEDCTRRFFSASSCAMATSRSL
jgi:hypothetical protein